jgi:hypothetical protein
MPEKNTILPTALEFGEPQDRLRERRSATEAIRQFMLGNVEELTAKERDLFDRYQTIQLLRVNMTRAKCIEEYCYRYQVSMATAERDLVLSKQLFGDLLARKKEGLRALWLDRAEEVYMKAYAEDDLGNMNKAIAVASKLIGSPDKEQFIPDPDVLGNNLFVFGGSKALESGILSIVEVMRQGGKLDLSKTPMPEYADFEDCPPTSEGGEDNPLSIDPENPEI